MADAARTVAATGAQQPAPGGDLEPYHDDPTAHDDAHLEPRHRDVEHTSHWDAPAFLGRVHARSKRRRTIMVLTLAGVIVLVIFVTTHLQWAPQGFQPIGYRSCERDHNIECGFVSVPRNYFNASEGRTVIAVARYRAPDTAKRVGTLFINPGGPGGSGVNMMFSIGILLSRLFEGRYDIVGFDPRGVGETTPALACFPTWREALAFRRGTVLQQGFNLPPGNPRFPKNYAALLLQMREWLALSQVEAEICLSAPEAHDIPHMSTATVVRDIDYMATLLDGEDALINYWGGSYGTVVGAYLVNMFPHRVGRVAIDGVVNPWEWSNVHANQWLKTDLIATEAAFDYILDKCGLAGPAHCALASHIGETAKEIGDRIDGYLATLYSNPIPYAKDGLSGIVTSGMVRSLLYYSTNVPPHFAEIAAAISAAMDGQVDDLAKMSLSAPSTSDQPRPGDHSRNVIACMDAPPFAVEQPETWPTAEDLANTALEVLENVSPRFGLSVSLFERDGACQFLAAAAANLPERFTGPFNHTLRNPIMIFSSDLDPITPLVSAQWVNNQLALSSRLVIQTNSPAHSTWLFGPSICVLKWYRRYFAYGDLPTAHETFCENDVEIFPSLTPPTEPPSEEDADFLTLVEELRAFGTDKFPPHL